MKHPALTRSALALAAALGTIAAFIPEADARPRPVGSQRRFSANKTFGIGLMLGAPTGLSGKYFLTPDTAIDFGVGIIRYRPYDRGRRGNVHLHVDYLLHPISLASTEPFELPLYFGLGARALDFDDDDLGDDGFAIGIRAPIGVAFDFNNIPLDAFIEFALVLDFFVSYRDTLGFDFNGAAGARYYFQ
jgi:hypothetical protein